MVFNALAAFIAVGFSFIPGILAAWALLKSVEINKWFKLVFGVGLGFTLLPLLAVLEFMAAGVKFSALVYGVNWVIIAAVSLFFLWRQGQLQLVPSRVKRRVPHLKKRVSVEGQSLETSALSRENAVLGWISNNKVAILMLLFLILTLYSRLATSWTPDFFEFDPYYYHGLTEKIVKIGELPAMSDDVYFTLDGSHPYTMRWPPILHYLEASWWYVYQAITGGPYDKNSLILLDSLYTPLSAALMVAAGFVLVGSVYSRYAGLATAGFLALTPQLIEKFAAGVAEQQPFGLMMAVLLFAAFVVAFKTRDRRALALSGFVAFVSPVVSQQVIWPFAVIAAFVFLQSAWEYFRGRLDAGMVWVLAGTAVAGFLGTALTAGYRLILNGFPDNLTLLLGASAVWCVLLFLVPKLKVFANRPRWLPFAALVGVLFVASLLPVLPGGRSGIGSVYSYALDAIGYQTATSPLSKTIQEAGATTAGFFEGAFGVMSPFVVLTALAIFAVIAIISSFLGREHNGLVLLFALLVVPVAFIGFGKVKFLVHMAVGLSIALGFILGELVRLSETWAEKLKSEMPKARRMALIVLAVVAIPSLFVQGFYAFGSPINMSCDSNASKLTSWIALPFKQVPSPVAALCNSRLSADWKNAVQWMRESTPPDSRFVSWWDYGHWINFLGERKSVLSPLNVYDDLNQRVAYAFVENTNELYNIMHDHKVQYVLVDSQLIPKWGALDFLSGTCDSKIFPSCPPSKRIPNWQAGAGASAYEFEHQFEYLYLVPQKCQVMGSQLPALQSTLSNYLGKPVVYCAAENQFLLATNGLGGVSSNYSRQFKIAGSAADIGSANVSYLFPFDRNVFVNINPDFSFAGLKASVFDSAFTKLFFEESLPGFELVYKSQPSGEVKIFKYLGSPTATTQKPTQQPTPQPTSQPTVAAPTTNAAPTPTPTPQSNASNSS